MKESKFMTSKYIRIYHIFLILSLSCTLLVLAVLGFYCHATGDDYVLSILAHQAYERGKGIFGVLAAAAEGTGLEYYRWQGNFVAMFLMQLAPNAFSESAYMLVPILLLALFVLGNSYFLHALLITGLHVPRREASCIILGILVLSLNVMPYLSDAIYWYNGGLYYTGFYSITLLLFGVLLRLSVDHRKSRIIASLLLGLAIGGSNYISLMPALILLLGATIAALIAWRRDTSQLPLLAGCAVAFCGALATMIISVIAPGNLVRADGAYGIPAWKAIAKSLLTGLSLIRGWIDLWWIVAILLMLPVFVSIYRSCRLRFRLPGIVIPLAYAIFCSEMTPTYYAQNTTGPIRILAIYYDSLILLFFFAVFYLGGWIYRTFHFGKMPADADSMTAKVQQTASGDVRTDIADADLTEKSATLSNYILTGCLAGACLLVIVQIVLGGYTNLNTYEAARELVSGEAAAYRAEYLSRMEVLNDETITDVVLPAYVTQPKLIHVGDFQDNANANFTVALYFHKRSLVVDL